MAITAKARCAWSLAKFPEPPHGGAHSTPCTSQRSAVPHAVPFYSCLPVKTFPNRDVDFGKPFYSVALVMFLSLLLAFSLEAKETAQGSWRHWLGTDSGLNGYWHAGLTCNHIRTCNLQDAHVHFKICLSQWLKYNMNQFSTIEKHK